MLIVVRHDLGINDMLKNFAGYIYIIYSHDTVLDNIITIL